MAGVVFVNPSSGPDDDGAELKRLFADHELTECVPEGFADQVRSAADRRPEFIGVAGGDGTLRTAAEVLRHGSVPLLAIPAGTRNHFARSLGIETLEDAAAIASAPGAGHQRRIDIGDVNGHCFINNSSIGLYPMLVVARESREKHMSKTRANLIAAYRQLTRGHTVDLAADGKKFRAWMAFVGNGPYGETAFDLAERTSLDANVLDLRIVRGDARLARTRVVCAVLTGRLNRSPLVYAVERDAVELVLPSGDIEVALDGEVETLTSPLRYTSQPEALPVLVPG